ncbi:MAG: hypothetical protein IE909_00525 [Campylobacterales bacterium]|nr:hypothetical protein [Campylobacterales bacterium]
MYFEDEQPIRVFKTTVSKVLKNLSAIENCPLEQFQECVVKNFAGYAYEGEDEVVGFDKWPDIAHDGTYELNAKVDHEHAYEFTIYIQVDNGFVTVQNVL